MCGCNKPAPPPPQIPTGGNEPPAPQPKPQNG